MNRSENILFCLFAVLLLIFGQGHAATVIWSDGFETNTPSRWTATGAWHIRSPTTGTHSGAKCALTQNYSYNQDGRIVCTKYLNGSNSLVVPDASVSPTLIFWHWVNLANALGYVELKSGTNDWQQISPTYLNVTSGGAWLQNSIDLSAFAGQSVQIGFHFTSGGCCGNAKGWYVDDVSLTVVVTTPPVLTVPDTQTIYAGQTLTVTNSATNIFLPNATYTFKLLSSPSKASITPNGVLTWTPSTNQPSGTNTMTVKVTDNSTPPLTATNSFVVVVVNPWMPVLTVPDTQTIFAGQPLVVTVSATNTFFPSATFTFTLLSGLTNVDAGFDGSDLPYDGVLSWTTTTALKVGTYTNVIKVTDNGAPYFSATNSFEIVVSKPPPPVLTVPTQTIYFGGSPLNVILSATNSAFPNANYTYKTNSAPAGTLIVIDPETGESSLTWTPTNAPSVKTITVTVTDDNSPPLVATNSFQVIVSPTPPPALIIPAPQPQPIHAGQTLAVTISATNIVLTDSMFNFSLKTPSNYVSIITTNNIGILTWTNTGISNGILTWTNISVGNKTINLIATATNNSPATSATNSFVFNFLPPLPPTLIGLTNQTINVGKTFTNILSATNNIVLTNVSYIFKLLPPSTNVSITANGVLTWTNTAAPPGSYIIKVKVTDNSVTPLSATNSFNVIVNPFPPVLIVSNLLTSSHSFQFSFHTLSNTTWRIDAATNLNAATNWLPIFTNTAGTSGTLQFTDLLATNYLRRFYRAVLP